MTDTRLIWVDMETTGLDADIEVPLELGAIITDEFGTEIDAFQCLVYEPNSVDYSNARKLTNDFVQKMHTDNDLWRDLNFALYDAGSLLKPLSRNRADKAICSWLAGHGVNAGELGMTGNSIGSLDRPFALKHFPMLNHALGYRNIDMSSIKELIRRLNPQAAAEGVEIIGTKENAPHRVLGDCRAAIKEYQFYIENFLVLGELQAQRYRVGNL